MYIIYDRYSISSSHCGSHDVFFPPNCWWISIRWSLQIHWSHQWLSGSPAEWESSMTTNGIEMAMAKWIKMATFKLCMVGFVMYGNKSFKGGFFLWFCFVFFVLCAFFCCNFSVDGLPGFGLDMFWKMRSFMDQDWNWMDIFSPISPFQKDSPIWNMMKSCCKFRCLMSFKFLNWQFRKRNETRQWHFKVYSMNSAWILPKNVPDENCVCKNPWISFRSEKILTAGLDRIYQFRCVPRRENQLR